jgi:hypothetical protein
MQYQKKKYAHFSGQCPVDCSYWMIASMLQGEVVGGYFMIFEEAGKA